MEQNQSTVIEKPTNGKVWAAIIFYFLFPVIGCILFWSDEKKLANYCKKVKGIEIPVFLYNVLWFILPPVYLWKRNKLLNVSQVTFWVCLVPYILIILCCIISGLATLAE